MRHVETYGPKELARYLESQGGLRVDKGSGHLDYVMPNGAAVPCPGHGQIVTILTGARVAELLGMTRTQLTAAVKGAEQSKAGKIRKGVVGSNAPRERPDDAPRSASRGDVVYALKGVVMRAESILSTLNGQRDPAYYAHLLRPISRARRCIDDAEDVAQQGKAS